jgi:pyruvate dehydrogenase E2 component (dihydrolipoamide acetyltransferase)
MATPILMPRQGQSVESCVLVSWTVKPGDAVKEGDTVASIETDKATFDVAAPASGTILELFFPEGADIPVLTHIGAIGKTGENIDGLRPGGTPSADAGTSTPPAEPSQPGPAPAASAPIAPAATPSPSAGVSPRARKAAASAGIDLSALGGSGPGGRVVERDVQAAAATAPRLSAAARTAASPGQPIPTRGTGPAGMVLAADLKAEAPAARTDTPVKGVRKIVADRMRQSLSTTAQLTLHMSFDASVIQGFRERVKARGEAFGVPRLTINDLISYAAVRALKKHPALNAHFLGDRIAQFGAVNLGMAVDTPRGLMVPVIRGADALPLRDLAAAIKTRAEECQKGSISPDLLGGGTFTITNLGALGVESFTPVLNAPEVAILGVCGIGLRPVRRDGSVAFVECIGLSLTIDHQAVDGAPAARFLHDLCEALENFDVLLNA